MGNRPYGEPEYLRETLVLFVLTGMPVNENRQEHHEKAYAEYRTQRPVIGENDIEYTESEISQ